MQKPIYNVFTKRNTLVAVICECTSKSHNLVSYNYTGKFAGCGKDLNEVLKRFDGYRIEEII